jgi:glycosyltransferase involved in cell wall biosynthesis
LFYDEGMLIFERTVRKEIKQAMTVNNSDFTVSVVVPVHNGGDDFRRCLTHLMQANPAPDEIVVVADGDTDGSGQLAETFGARVINIPIAGGPARARNLGARAAIGDILFFVDADVAIAPNAIREIKTAFTEQPEPAALFGSYDDNPGQKNFLSQYKNLMHHYVHQTGSEAASTFWSGCGAIRRDLFLKMGGFDIGYPHPCIEDIELGYRLKHTGHHIRLLKSLQGKHLKHWGAASLIKTDFLRRALPWTELILRDKQVINDLNLGGSSRASVMLVFALLGTLVLAGGSALFSGWLAVALLAVSGLLAVTLLVLNFHVYRFFWQKRGLLFAAGVIPWHWFYYFYGGLAFVIGVALFKGRQWGLTTVTFLPTQPTPFYVEE